MKEKPQNIQGGDAAYGNALLCNRGGWTLREMLGSDYEQLSKAAPFVQKDFQESLEKISRRVPSPSTTPRREK